MFQGWKPATEDLTEMNYYKQQYGKQYLGLDPMYLSRSNSAPGELSSHHLGLPTSNTPNDFVQELPKDVDVTSPARSSAASDSPNRK